MSQPRHPHSQSHSPPSFERLPQAIIQRNWKTRFIWLIPIAAAVIAAWFLYTGLFKGGPTLHILFDNSEDLQKGKSEIKYRGAQIGEVKDVALTKDHRYVQVEVSLDRSAASVAREGSQFWIVQPEVGVKQIRGLRTMISGDYIAVEPGNGKPQTRFMGLSQEPVIEPTNVLRIVLLAEKAGSLRARTPVFYRGVQVGEVFKCDLGPKSQTISIDVDIRQHYAPLVRMNSKFWNAGGLHMNLNLSGLNIAAQSAETLISGGISFATPDAREKEAPPGTTFRLYDKPEDPWLAWSPPIELGDHQATNGPVTITPK